MHWHFRKLLTIWILFQINVEHGFFRKGEEVQGRHPSVLLCFIQRLQREKAKEDGEALLLILQLFCLQLHIQGSVQYVPSHKIKDNLWGNNNNQAKLVYNAISIEGILGGCST